MEKFFFFILFSCLIFVGCSSMNKGASSLPEHNPAREEFLKGQSLTLTGEYERAIPFLVATIKKKTSDEEQALLLLARCNDQMAQPEKVIQFLNQLLEKHVDAVTELKARTLLAKNQTKLNPANQKPNELRMLRSLISSANNDMVLVLENLRWAMDFSCDQYCLAEVSFLQNIQSEYLFIIEADERASSRAASILEDKYSFFVRFLDKDFLSDDFKKQLLLALINSLTKFKALQPLAVTQYLNSKINDEPDSAVDEPEVDPSEQKQYEIQDSELSTQVKIFSNLDDLLKRLVAKYDSIKSTN
jgi:hypothetical protein